MATELVLVDIPYPATEVKDDGSVEVNRVRALWDFKADREEQLPFSKGDVIVVLNQSDECPGWWYGELDVDLPPMEGERGEGEGEGAKRKRGMFPVNYVEVVEIERLIVRKMKIDRSKVSDRIRLLQMKMNAGADDSGSESEAENTPEHDEGVPSQATEPSDSADIAEASVAPPSAPDAPGTREKPSEVAPAAPTSFEPARAEKARKMREARERRRKVMREEAAAAKKAEEEAAAASHDSDEDSSDGEASDDDSGSEKGSESEAESGSGSESESESEGEGEHELVDEEDVEEEILNDEDIDLEEEKQWERLAVRQLSVSGSDAESSGSEMEVTEDMLSEIRLQRASRRKRIRQQRKRTPSQLRSRDEPPPPTPPMNTEKKEIASEADEAASTDDVSVSAPKALEESVTDATETMQEQEERSSAEEEPAVQEEQLAETPVKQVEAKVEKADEKAEAKENAVSIVSTADSKEGVPEQPSGEEPAPVKPKDDVAPAKPTPIVANAVAAKAEPMATPPEMKARRKVGPMRHASSTVWEAVVSGDLEFLRRFLAADEFKVMVNGRNEKGQAALHLAVVAKQKAVCEMLVREGASVSVLDRNNCMPHRLAGCTPELRNVILSNVCVQPTWVPDSTSTHCMLCDCKFTLFHRRHHCRNCGTLACSHCCSTRKAVPNLDIAEPSRVCNDCSEVLE